MPKKKIDPQATPRPDLNLRESDYIAQSRKPNFDISREERVRDGYRRGLPLVNLMKASGYTPSQLFAVLKLDEAADHEVLTELTREHEKQRGVINGPFRYI